MSATHTSLPEHWTSISAIRKQLMSKWANGQLLIELIQSSDLFPLRLPLKTPTSREMGAYFPETRDWIQRIEKGLATTSFQLEWRQVNHRQLGRNQLPAAVIIPDLPSALSWLHKKQEGKTFVQLANQVVTQFPSLHAWVIQYPHRLLQLEAIISSLIAVVDWRLKHHNPNIYLRQLSLPGIDTKFIEQHKKILSEWLDMLLPESQINAIHRPNCFAERYLFLQKPVLIRFRLLDPNHDIHGLSDLTVPIADFARLSLDVDWVFVIENDINGLVFPEVAKAMVLFGRGYGFDYLQQVSWIKQKRIVYWGDIDTHGFAILNQFRAYLPQTKSMLMDVNTLTAHRAHWGEEKKQTKAQLPNLTQKEQALYLALQSHEYGQRVRLEQEYILYEWMVSALADSCF